MSWRGSAKERYGIVVAGTYAPPFRPLTEEEEREVAHGSRKRLPMFSGSA